MGGNVLIVGTKGAPGCPHPDPLPSDGRGNSDWMRLVFCEWVVRDTCAADRGLGAVPEWASGVRADPIGLDFVKYTFELLFFMQTSSCPVSNYGCGSD